MIAYIYNPGTREIDIEIGESNEVIEQYIEAHNLIDTDTQGLTYSPGFGANDGLIRTDATKTIELR